MKIAAFGVSLLASVFTFVPVHALLSGSGKITPQDYIGLPAAALATNPPACGMPYATLDLGRITAVQALVKSTDCNKCIKVVNTKNNKFIYALAVDLGGMGLDLSIPSFKELFGQQYDASPASWSETDYSNCAGIYSKGGASSNSTSTSAAAKHPTTTKKSSSHPRPTATKVKSSSTHIRPTTTKISKKPSHHARPTTTKAKAKKPTTKLAHPTSTKTKSSHHGRPTTTKTKSPHHHGRPTNKTKSPGRDCPSKKHKNKKNSTAGRRKHQHKSKKHH